MQDPSIPQVLVVSPATRESGDADTCTAARGPEHSTR